MEVLKLHIYSFNWIIIKIIMITIRRRIMMQLICESDSLDDYLKETGEVVLPSEVDSSGFQRK